MKQLIPINRDAALLLATGVLRACPGPGLMLVFAN